MWAKRKKHVLDEDERGVAKEETWKIGTLDVCSLVNKTGGFISHLEDEDCDVCLIQETF